MTSVGGGMGGAPGLETAAAFSLMADETAPIFVKLASTYIITNPASAVVRRMPDVLTRQFKFEIELHIAPGLKVKYLMSLKTSRPPVTKVSIDLWKKSMLILYQEPDLTDEIQTRPKK